MKHKLKIKYYLRYCDDFVILDTNPSELKKLVRIIDEFLKFELRLSLHEDKIIIRRLNQGIDFLGYIVLSYYRTLRTKTKRRMLKRVNVENLASYLGLLKHCHSYKLSMRLNNVLRN